jgi:predicted GIY-YIG superfamily endonuclease
MAFWVYTLQSEVSGLHYCGQTTDVERRLRQHDDPDYWRYVAAVLLMDWFRLHGTSGGLHVDLLGQNKDICHPNPL